MQAITTVSTYDGAKPGDVVEVPDNEAPGLLAQGFIKPLDSGDSEPRQSEVESSDETDDESASEMDARPNEESDARADQEV